MPISALSKVGLAIEETWGAGAPPAVIMPVESHSLTEPFEQILDNAKRGVVAKDFQAYQGVGRAEASLEGEVFPDLFGYILRPVFGSVVRSGTAMPYKFTFSFHPDPPSLAITDDTVVRKHCGVGMMASEFSLTFNPTEGALKYSLSLTGKKVEIVTYPFPSEVHTSAPFFLGWGGSIALNGQFFPVIEGELTVSREVTLHYFLQNSQFAGTAYVGAPEVTGSFTIDYTSGTADYDLYREHRQGSVDLYYLCGNRSLKVVMGSVDFGEGAVELDRSGASITMGLSWRALYVPSLGGPAIAELVCNAESF